MPEVFRASHLSSGRIFVHEQTRCCGSAHQDETFHAWGPSGFYAERRRWMLATAGVRRLSFLSIPPNSDLAQPWEGTCPMPRINIDLDFLTHPKTVSIDPLSELLHVRALQYCA